MFTAGPAPARAYEADVPAEVVVETPCRPRDDPPSAARPRAPARRARGGRWARSGSRRRRRPCEGRPRTPPAVSRPAQEESQGGAGDAPADDECPSMCSHAKQSDAPDSFRPLMTRDAIHQPHECVGARSEPLRRASRGARGAERDARREAPQRDAVGGQQRPRAAARRPGRPARRPQRARARGHAARRGARADHRAGHRPPREGARPGQRVRSRGEHAHLHHRRRGQSPDERSASHCCRVREEPSAGRAAHGQRRLPRGQRWPRVGRDSTSPSSRR